MRIRTTLARTSVVLSLLLLSVVPSATAAAAADPVNQSVTGPFLVSIKSVNVQPVDGICRIGLTATFSFTGSLTGSFTAPFSILHLGPCAQAAQEVFDAHGTYVGSVAGIPGSFDFVFAGAIDASGQARGELVVLQGQGGLRGLHGRIELSGQSGVGGTYAGTVTLGS